MSMKKFRSIRFVFVLMLVFVACSAPEADTLRTPTAGDTGSSAPTASPTGEQSAASVDPTSEPVADASPTTEAAAAETTQPEAASPTPPDPAAPTPEMTPAPGGPPPAATQAPVPEAPANLPEGVLPSHRVLAFYGHPSTPAMGILGAYSKEDLLGVLREQAAAYEAADPSTPVKMALEIIATAAQPNPGEDGTYVLYTGDEWIQEYVDFAAANDMILILDLQIGHSTIREEIERVRKWLEYPNVHVALDPEFSTGPDRIPGEFIGEVDGNHVQIAVELLSQLVLEKNLPPKILMVHQFEREMIYNKDAITPMPGVDIVIDMDGFGSPEAKTGNYNVFVGQELIEYGGIKLFYQQDEPLLTPEEIVSHQPPPAVVIYQ